MLFSKHKRKPRLSIVVIAYNMPRQLQNTLYSLSGAYQQGVEKDDYEVIVMENQSANTLDTNILEQWQGNFHYHLRQETLASPINAINEGISLARGNNVAVMIDGARMVTPGIIHHTLRAFELSKNAVVAVPGYHLGREIQQESSLSGYDETVETELLKSINWQHNGYDLFTIACLSKSCEQGLFYPIPESNWLAMSSERYSRLGGYEAGFDSHGGGYANLDAFKRAVELEDSEVIMLGGEGCFHQFHSGVTTDANNKHLPSMLDELHQQYRTIRGQDFTAPEYDPIILGPIPASAHRFFSPQSH